MADTTKDLIENPEETKSLTEEAKTLMKTKAQPKGLKWVAWKFFGALFMEEKTRDGVTAQAVSHHKTLGFVLFLVVVGIWCFGGTWLSDAEVVKLAEDGTVAPSKWGVPPNMMVYTLWALIGLKGVSKVAEKMKK